jgi:hypothetical protein
MTDAEYDELMERFESATDEVLEAIHQLEDIYQEARDALWQKPANEMNTVIQKGFVPGARFRFKGTRVLVFSGFTVEGRMAFIEDARVEPFYVDAKQVLKRLDDFSRMDGEVR